MVRAVCQSVCLHDDSFDGKTVGVSIVTLQSQFFLNGFGVEEGSPCGGSALYGLEVF
jgi:hypothetical protein